MIPKISRGWRVRGLVEYLLGPGRANEHTDQHVIASWDGLPVQPERDREGRFDVAELAADLAEPAELAGLQLREPPEHERSTLPPGPVWHCSLRNHADDRRLTDAEWAEVVEDLMHETGIARRGDVGACRWVAVRHADDHVHVAAVLIRQDTGRRVHPHRDYLRAGKVARAAEERLGLTRTASQDRTAPAQLTRAEMEKTERQRAGRGGGEPARVWLRRAVQQAAVEAQDEAEFFARLRREGAHVRLRESAPGTVAGYAVAAPDDLTAEGRPVFYSGGKLARDLTLPQLRQRWESAPRPSEQVPAQPGERVVLVSRGERQAALDEAVDAMGGAVEQLRQAHTTGEDADDVAHAAGDMYIAARLVDRGRDGRRLPPDLLDRAARSPKHGTPQQWSPRAAALRTASWRLARALHLPSSRGDDWSRLVAALVQLAVEVAAYRDARQQPAQAQAARRAVEQLSSLHRQATTTTAAARARAPRPPARAPQPPVRPPRLDLGAQRRRFGPSR